MELTKIKNIMRFYSILRCFRLKRLLFVTFLALFVMISIKITSYFKFKTSLNYKLLQNHLKNNNFAILHSISTNFTIGGFLKSKFPGNLSFCNFRFGTVGSFNYTEEDISMAPELGDKGPYRILYNVVEGINYNSTSSDTITYVTHMTLDYLLHTSEILIRWDGLVSVAAFLPGTDAHVALRSFEKLCYCLRQMENITIHFIFHVDHPPKVYTERVTEEEYVYDNYTFLTTSALDKADKLEIEPKLSTSASLPYFDNKPFNRSDLRYIDYIFEKYSNTCYIEPDILRKDMYRSTFNLVYPVNVCRNVARMGAKSKYVLVSDIELLPSKNLVEEFLKMIKRIHDRNKSLGDHYFTKKRHVYVIPVFEVADDVTHIPRTKVELLDLYSKEKAVYFHRYVCLHCQRFPGIQRWLQKKLHPRTKPGTIQPLVVVKREFPYHRWEPIYIGTNDEPLYSELLTWEGQQDKMTQMHEMCLLDYRFVILNGAFLVHTPGIKRKPDKLLLNKLINKANQFFNSKSRKNTTKVLYHTTSQPSVATPKALNWRTEHIKRNAYLYQLITQDMVDKYHNNPRCRIH